MKLRNQIRIALLFGLGLACSGCPAPVVTPPPPPPPPPTATPKPIVVNKSSLDKRLYRALSLDNGMKVLVVSDPDTDMAAASLDVHVGHFVDPKDREGLAHFLEHMLFMGTKKYPDPDGYHKYVKAHGGSSNAGTGGEHTSYFFRVEHSALEEGLDRFAQFFVAPLLDPTLVKRERNAVNAEYRMKIKDASRRGRQVRKATTNPAHPESKFSVGNLETLADTPNKPVYADLRQLYETYYGPKRMAVAVIGRQDLDTLESWVKQRFEGVKGKPKARAKRPRPFTADQLGVRIDIESLRDARRLELQWVLPPREQMWPKRPHGYLSSILGHEGEGSLFALLKKRGWIEALIASFGDSADDHDILSLDIPLTEQGFAHLDDVIDAVLQMVRLMQKNAPEPAIYNDARSVSRLDFKFMEELSPDGLVQRASNALHYYPPSNVLDWWATWSAFDPTLVKDLLARMTVDKMRVLVTSKEAKTDQVEPLYNVAWAMRKLTAEERTRWGSGAIDASLAMPKANPWLPRELSLKKGPPVEKSPVEPVLVAKKPGLEVWHRHDTEFGAPRGYVALRLATDSPNNLKANVLGQLYARLLSDSLELWAYPVKLAGLSFHWRASTGGLELRVTGFDDKQPEVFAPLLERLTKLQIDPGRFALEQAELARDWDNQRLGRPYTQAIDAMGVATNPEDWSRPAAVKLLRKLSVADLEAWRKKMLGRVWAQLFVHGNHSLEDARAFAKLVEQQLLTTAKPGAPGDNRTRLLVKGSTTLEIAVDHDDSTLIVGYQSQKTDLVTAARYLMLGTLLGTPFFNDLRAKQQLGYIVSAHYYRFDVLPGLRFLIQSSSKDPDTLLARVDAFIAGQREAIAKLPDAEFMTVRNGLIAKLLEKHTQLYQRSGELHRNLQLRRAWDYNAQVAQQLKTFDRAAISAFYDEAVGATSARLVVRSVGRKHKVKTKPDCRTIDCASRKLRKEHKRPR